jgi:ankyrin repeat protein
VSRGFRPRERTDQQLTPLHLAAAANWLEGIEILLAGGADKYAQDSNQRFPIDHAFQVQSLKSIELLLEGDCVPYFERSQSIPPLTIGWCIGPALLQSSGGIQNAIIGSLAAHRHLLKDIRPYHDLMILSYGAESELMTAAGLFSAGFQDLDQTDVTGKTPLMLACSLALFEMIPYLLEFGADPSKPHRDSNLTAGYFLLGNCTYATWRPSDFERCAKVIQVAFDQSGTIVSTCRCSPKGFTPISAIFQSYRASWDRREILRAFLPWVRWPSHMIQEQVRAFALGEIFNRLEMTHTCIRLYRPDQQVLDEDRLDIEDEEEELNIQLQELMNRFETLRAGFGGNHLDLLDCFLEDLEQDLPPLGNSCSRAYDWKNKNLLGPGRVYGYSRYNFKGEQILYGHTECLGDENMLALLFGQEPA